MAIDENPAYLFKFVGMVCVHPGKEMFYGSAPKQDKSYMLLAEHRLFQHTKSIEAVIVEYEEI